MKILTQGLRSDWRFLRVTLAPAQVTGGWKPIESPGSQLGSYSAENYGNLQESRYCNRLQWQRENSPGHLEYFQPEWIVTSTMDMQTGERATWEEKR